MATAVDVAAVRRRVAKVRLVEGSSLELDSHADLAVLGADCHVLARTGKVYEVYGYDESLGSESGEVVSPIFRQTVHFFMLLVPPPERSSDKRSLLRSAISLQLDAKTTKLSKFVAARS